MIKRKKERKTWGEDDENTSFSHKFIAAYTGKLYIYIYICKMPVAISFPPLTSFSIP